MAIVPILAAHDYELELTWTSISLAPAKGAKRAQRPDTRAREGAGVR